MSNKATWIVVIVILLAGLGVWYFTAGSNNSGLDNSNLSLNEDNQLDDVLDQEELSDNEETLNNEEENNEVIDQPAVKEFEVTASNFSFSLKEIKVKQGDKVRIVFKNAEGFHDWKLDEFNAATKQIGTAQQETVEFTADKKGTFEYYCSVGQHRANGMKGNLIVE